MLLVTHRQTYPGKGLAAARRAIVNGLQETVHEFAENINGVDPQTVMQLILTTQYYDTLKEIGAHSRSNAIFLPPKDFQQPTRDALFANSAIEDDQPLLTKSRTNWLSTNALPLSATGQADGGNDLHTNNNILDYKIVDQR